MSTRKTTVFSTFGLNSPSGSSSSAPLRVIALHRCYAATKGNARVRTVAMVTKCPRNCSATVSRMYGEKRFTGGFSGDSVSSGLEAEIRDRLVWVNVHPSCDAQIVKNFNLSKCLHVQLGGVHAKGISGGEMRRVTLATELINYPSILFCDEPTSGLDSYMAETVIKTLRVLVLPHTPLQPRPTTA